MELTADPHSKKCTGEYILEEARDWRVEYRVIDLSKVNSSSVAKLIELAVTVAIVVMAIATSAIVLQPSSGS